MTDERDPTLEALFGEARQELGGEAFTAQVMRRTRFARLRAETGWIGAAALLLVAGGLLFVPLQELAVLLAQALSTALFDLGESWLALVLAPINSVATVVVLGARILRVGRKRFRESSYA